MRYAVDEEGLFQSVCNILVRSGLFQFAWFGYAAANGSKAGEPIPCSGNIDGFLEDLKIGLRQDNYEDPANVAIRTGAPCWIEDLAGHPGLGPIRAAVLRQGYTSVISVPVFSKDTVYAALTLYYSDPEEYGQAVVSVLKEQLAHLQAVFAGRPPTPRRRSEEFEAELRNLLDVLPLNVGLCDATGELLYINRRVVEYTGHSLEDMVLRGSDCNFPGDFERVRVEVANGFSRGVPFEYETRQLRQQDQQYRWALEQVSPIRDEDGQIIRWCFAGLDIEERKRAEQKIRQSEADLLEAQRISHTGSWKHDLASGMVSVTPQVVKMFGIQEDASALTAEFFFARIHPEDRPLEAIQHERAVLTKADFESDYRIVLPDGSVRYVHNIGHPKLNEAGDPVELVGTVIDVTAAKQAEEKIRQSEREARQLLDLSPLHITELGPDGTRIYNNRAALDYYGLTIEEWQAADFQTLFHPQDAELAMSEVPGKLRDGSPFEYEARL
jgi:PAS domain S-box-containing protein